MTAKKKTAKKKNSVNRSPGQAEKTNMPLLASKPNELSPMAAMQMAISSGADLDKLEKMLELQAKWEDREAKKAYVQAMADFKNEPPEIEKDSHVKYQTEKGLTEYDHASLGNVTDKINNALSEHGLSSAWSTQQNDGNIMVTCTITHRLGHSESTSLAAPPDSSGKKNTIQSIGSTITYLERYTLLSLTGLATHDQDNDGRAPAATKEDEKRSRAVRAKYNQQLLAIKSKDDFNIIVASFKKLHGNFNAFTYHNKTETFLELFNEYKSKIERIEKDQAPIDAKDAWAKDMENCTSSENFYVLEDEFIKNPGWSDEDAEALINSIGEKLGMPNYTN